MLEIVAAAVADIDSAAVMIVLDNLRLVVVVADLVHILLAVVVIVTCNLDVD